MEILVLRGMDRQTRSWTDLLIARGHVCIHATTTLVADRMLFAREIDALIVDAEHPGRSTVEWLETLARFRPALARRTLVTGRASMSPSERERVSRCGAGLMIEPFPESRIVDLLERQREASGA